MNSNEREMTTRAHPATDISLRNAAAVAGTGLLVMSVFAPVSNFLILQKLMVTGDAAATVKNIRAAAGLFRIGIGSFLLVAVLDIIVAWALYVLFKPVNKSLSLLAAWFRVVYATVLIAVLNNLMNIVELLDDAGFLSVFEQSLLNAQAMLNIHSFQNGWNLGMIIFGLHLLILGYLIFRSGYFPRMLGILVIVSSLGYLVDCFGKLLIPGYNLTIAMVTFAGEVLLMFWLLLRGIKGFAKT